MLAGHQSGRVFFFGENNMVKTDLKSETRLCKLDSCKKSFKPTTPQQFYCCPKRRDLKYTAKKDWKVERKCKLQSCGKAFIPNQYHQEFHTKDCHKKSIAANFKERECGVQHCTTVFKPIHRHHIYCSDECLKYARRPLNHAAAMAYQKSKKKGAYMTDEQFREKALATLPLKCTQTACAPDCRIRGVERFGCVA